MFLQEGIRGARKVPEWMLVLVLNNLVLVLLALRPPARFLSGLDNLQIARFNFKINYKSWIKNEWQSTLLYSVKQLIHSYLIYNGNKDRQDPAQMNESLRSQAFRLLRAEWRE